MLSLESENLERMVSLEGGWEVNVGIDFKEVALEGVIGFNRLMIGFQRTAVNTLAILQVP